MSDQLGQTLRLDPSYPDEELQSDKYDEFGFSKKESQKAALPIFIPFERLMEQRARKDN